jgi:hypothetical protein
MNTKHELTKKKIADIDLKEVKLNEFKDIGPKENNKPKFKNNKDDIKY